MVLTHRAIAAASAVTVALTVASSVPAGAAAGPAPVGRSGPAASVLSTGALMDISKRAGNEAETAVAIQQTNTAHFVVVSNLASGAGLVHMWSTDGGTTWNENVIATGSDGLAGGCCDPSLTSDGYGNVFMAYLSSSTNATAVAISTDGGATFQPLHTVVPPAGPVSNAPTRGAARTGRTASGTDQPTIVAGHREVWVTMTLSSGRVAAAGARVKGLGVVGAWKGPEKAPNTSCNDCDFGDIAIGPSGQVMITYQTPTGGEGPSSIYTALDPDGLGAAGFATPTLVTTTNVGGFDYIPAQHERSIDGEVGLAWDHRRDRLYVTWTSETPDESNNTDIMFASSSDEGTTWSTPVQLNTDATTRSQFLPKMALDPTTGNIVVTWYDCRKDAGAGGIGDTDGIVNDDAMLYAVVIKRGGTTFSKNIRISQAASNASDSGNAIDYGDYEGLAYDGGLAHPAWADNSNTVGTNPNGTLHALDVYSVKIQA